MNAEFPEPPPQGGVNPNALTVEQAAKLLTKVGTAPVTEEQIRADLAAGAPINPDGTINVVHYGAWCVREMQNGRKGRPSG